MAQFFCFTLFSFILNGLKKCPILMRGIRKRKLDERQNKPTEMIEGKFLYC